MIVNFVYNDNLTSIILPTKVSGQFWFTDPNGKKILRIESVDNKWMLKTTSCYKVRVRDSADGNIVDVNASELVSRSLYPLKNNESSTDKIYILTEEYTEDRIEFFLFMVPAHCTLSIGNGRAQKSIAYDNNYVSSNQATLQWSGGKWQVQDDGSKNGIFCTSKVFFYAFLLFCIERII